MSIVRGKDGRRLCGSCLFTRQAGFLLEVGHGGQVRRRSVERVSKGKRPRRPREDPWLQQDDENQLNMNECRFIAGALILLQRGAQRT